jgi:citrate synthase
MSDQHMSDQHRSEWQTSVSRVDEGKVLIRGYDLEALIGGQSFTSSCFLLLRGRLPWPGEERALDAVLNAVLDYALLKPGTVAARYAVSANPSMVAGLAAAVLSVGSYTLAPEDTARFASVAYERHLAAGTSLTETAGAIVADARARKERIPGIGHPLFKGVDPRAQKLKQVAVAEGLWSDRADLYEHVHRTFVDAIGKPDIPINDVGMMALVMLELGFTPDEMTGLAVLSTLPGVIAHVSEELASGRRIRTVPDDLVDYTAIEPRDFTTDRHIAGWDTQHLGEGT